MLDDLTFIHQHDQQDALGIVQKQGQQLRADFELSSTSQFGDVHNVVYAGMGGSALAALIAQTFPQIKVPFTIVRDYNLPSYVDSHTLVICASYSGNTEETLEALTQAEDRLAQIAVITGGGELKERATTNKYPMLELPKTAQPRYAVLSNYLALVTLLAKSGLLYDESDALAKIKAASKFIDAQTMLWAAEVPTAKNPAKQLAQELLGKSVVVYAGSVLYPAAYKWKISVNENAKQVAWATALPEFNHNEFIGWSKQPVDKPYAVIDLRSSFEHPRIQKRFEVSARLLSGMRPEPHVVNAEGSNKLEQLLWASAFGDFVTIYLGLLNNLNPAPVELVEKFKKALDE